MHMHELLNNTKRISVILSDVRSRDLFELDPKLFINYLLNAAISVAFKHTYYRAKKHFCSFLFMVLGKILNSCILRFSLL